MRAERAFPFWAGKRPSFNAGRVERRTCGRHGPRRACTPRCANACALIPFGRSQARHSQFCLRAMRFRGSLLKRPYPEGALSPVPCDREADSSTREPLLNVAIADLRPTQITVGFREVADKRQVERDAEGGPAGLPGEAHDPGAARVPRRTPTSSTTTISRGPCSTRDARPSRSTSSPI